MGIEWEGGTVTGSAKESFPEHEQNRQEELEFKCKQDASKCMQVDKAMAGQRRKVQKRK